MSKFDYAKAVSSTGQFIKDNKKPLLIVGGAIAVVIVGVVLTKSASSAVKNIFGGMPKAKRESQFSTQAIDTAKTTISPEKANMYANQLYNAMRDAGTVENTIKAILNATNGEDYKMIYNAFGTRTYSGLNGGEPGWLTIWSASDLDLNEWFKKEVDSLTDPITYKLIEKRCKEAGFAF